VAFPSFTGRGRDSRRTFPLTLVVGVVAFRVLAICPASHPAQ